MLRVLYAKGARESKRYRKICEYREKKSVSLFRVQREVQLASAAISRQCCAAALVLVTSKLQECITRYEDPSPVFETFTRNDEKRKKTPRASRCQWLPAPTFSLSLFISFSVALAQSLALFVRRFAYVFFPLLLHLTWGYQGTLLRSLCYWCCHSTVFPERAPRPSADSFRTPAILYVFSPTNKNV